MSVRNGAAMTSCDRAADSICAMIRAAMPMLPVATIPPSKKGVPRRVRAVAMS